MSKYFYTCKTKSELKARYRKLLKMYHPDNGGNLQTMQEINMEYEALIDKLPEAETEKKMTMESKIPSALYAAIEKIKNIPVLNIEICGKWVWVSGNTYPVKDALKAAGFKFSGKKKMWYFHEENECCRKYGKRKETDMETIRFKYGSEEVYGKSACIA